MVSVNASNNSNNKLGVCAWILSGLLLFTLAFVVWEGLVLEGLVSTTPTAEFISSLRAFGGHKTESFLSDRIEDIVVASELLSKGKQRPAMVSAIFDESRWERHNQLHDEMKKIKPNPCGYSHGIFDLTEEEMFPEKGDRHMVTPPQGGKLSLVCCETTQGNLAIVAHHKWAPLGAARFIQMVKQGYFDSTVPLMRCVKNFICQFGLNSDPAMTKRYNKNLKDDPPWLPEGPKYRENKDGVKRFAKGYLAYAGSGKDSRSNQFIMSLAADGPLAGGSPWEVPWGELVGEESFETIKEIYTGYGEDGPPQGKLHNRGMDKELQLEFPKIDYINGCMVVDERVMDHTSADPFMDSFKKQKKKEKKEEEEKGSGTVVPLV